jgi:predicted NBD/HSP70 family sugar kinase
MFLDESGEDCYCGRHGCVETIISGPALERFYYAKTGIRKKLSDILNDLEEDPVSVVVKQRLIYFFGKALGHIINLIDPDVIVLGGGLSNVSFLYTEGVFEASQHIFNPELTTPIVAPSLGDSAGVFGAALLIS